MESPSGQEGCEWAQVGAKTVGINHPLSSPQSLQESKGVSMQKQYFSVPLPQSTHPNDHILTPHRSVCILLGVSGHEWE